MKKKYMKPMITIVCMPQSLCSSPLTDATVETRQHEHVDHFKVVNEEESQDSYDWSSNAWGGN